MPNSQSTSSLDKSTDEVLLLLGSIENNMKDVNAAIADFDPVKESIKALKDTTEEIKKNTTKGEKGFEFDKAFESTVKILKCVDEAIPVFKNPDSNGFDIASSAVAIASSVVAAFSILPGAKMIVGPISCVLKVVGSILGKFGHKETKTNYYDVMEQMLTDANSLQSTEETWAILNGTLAEMRGVHYDMIYVLSRSNTKADIAALKQFARSPQYFNDLGNFELGQAYTNMENNLKEDHSANWRNSADTFLRINEVIAFKLLLMTEAIAYFQLIESDVSSTINSGIMINSLEMFMANASKQIEKYFARPTIKRSVITHWIYRMPKPKFVFIAKVYDHLQQALNRTPVHKMFFYARPAFYPENTVNNFRFDNCKFRHADGVCVRLNTLINPGRALSTPKQAGKDGDRDISLWMAADTDTREGVDPQKTHFSIWANEDTTHPCYSWELQARVKGVQGTEYHHSNLYIFYVYPTASEIDPAITANWAYVMIGSRDADKKDEEQVWASEGDYFRKVPAKTALYSKEALDHHTYGDPRCCLWYFRGQD